jgi:cytosine/adenosine deaminase-related metal-dependent hydrolase
MGSMRFDILIHEATVVTMDADRRVLRSASIGVTGQDITFVGAASEVNGSSAGRVIPGADRLVMPGLIDAHAHAGHGLTKTLAEGGIGLVDGWDEFMEAIYFRGTTLDFWKAEARLTGLERLKFGVTTGLNMLGSYPRYDDLAYAEAHVEGMTEVGVRDILGIGPPNPPYPKRFLRWEESAAQRERVLSHEESFVQTREAVRRFNNTRGGLTFCYPTPSGVGRRDGLTREEMVRQNAAMKAIAEEFGTPVHGHAYGGDIRYAFEHFDVLGPRLSLAHVTGIDAEEIRILADTGTHVCSGPHTHAVIRARCPVVELLESGVNVAFCTDASAPDRTYDLFEKLRIGLMLHRSHFRDPAVLPAGKALEMVTIDAARALGLERTLGSVAVGKKADIILINTRQPHLYPIWQEPLRLVYQVSGHDVDTVIVNGRVLMENRSVLTVDEGAALVQAQAEALKMLERTQFQQSALLPERLWGCTHY